tara:strand:+ start:1962 stop:5411 length:3450 start_codon:yes stop_codon:yes gene_type:complete
MLILAHEVKINDISLQPSMSPSGSSSIQISSNVGVSYSAGTNLNEQLSGLRMRLAFTFSESSAKNMDYVSQRYNEYNSDDYYSTQCTTYKFNKYLKKVLGDNSLLSNDSVFSPFASNLEQVSMIFKEKTTPIGTGRKIPQDVLLYDCPMNKLVMRKSDGSIEVTKQNTNSLEVMLKDISINFANQGVDFSNLSVYAFVYNPSLANTDTQLDFVINTGVSRIESLCLRGTKNLFLPISNENVFVSMLGSTSNNDTDSNKLKLFEPVSVLSLDSLTSESFIGTKNRLLNSLGTRKNDLRKVISSSNYVSELWITRDNQNNNRLLFAIDLASYLSENSSHPFLYDKEELSEAMISGLSPLAPKELSSIKDITVYRRFCSPTAVGSSNSLGTTSKNVPIKPSEAFPRVPLKMAKPVDFSTSDTESKRIQYFEAIDIINPESQPNRQINGLFRYEIEYSVYDSSCKFLRNVSNRFTKIKSDIDKSYQDLTRGRFRDSSGALVSLSNTGVLLSSLEDIVTVNPDGTQGPTLYNYIIDLVQEYDRLINNFNTSDEKINLAEIYATAMEKNFGKINISLLSGLQQMVQVGIDFITKKLLKTYPNDPYGYQPDLSKRSPRMGTLPAYRTPFSVATHIFNNTVEIGKDYNFGLDYVGANIDEEGLPSISIESYENRMNDEFKKYFQTGQGSTVPIPPGSYLNSSYSYFTPFAIYSPNRETIFQPSYGDSNGLSVNYDLDRYALLLEDIVEIKTKTKDKGIFYPDLSLKLKKQTKSNRLFSGASKLLLDKYGVTISDSITESFEPPRVITGDQDTTVTDGDDECNNKRGLPLIPTILGGLNSLEAQSYISLVNLAIKNKDQLQLAASVLDLDTRKQLSSKPIKLAFSLLSEMEINGKVSDVSKINTSYNSFTDLRKVLGINQSNIKEKIEESPISEMPNQIKSMLAISSTPDVLPLGDFESGLSFDVCRPRLGDPIMSDDSKDLVSFYSDDEDIPPYQQALDPMKSYVNFLAFWMNYKQLCVVEYLDGFDDLEVNDETYADMQTPYTSSKKLGLPRWRQLSSDAISLLQKSDLRGQLLCRVRQLQSSDYVDMLSSQLNREQIQQVARIFNLDETFRMPLYNQYFYLGGGTTNNTEFEFEPEIDNMNVNETVTSSLFTTGY